MKEKSTQEKAPAPLLVRVKRAGQITLPLELRKQCHLTEGDYLEVTMAEGSLRLQPVAVVARQAQARGTKAKSKKLG